MSQIASAFGLSTAAANAYSSERQMISKAKRIIQEITYDSGQIPKLIKENETEANTNLQELPQLMNAMFDCLEKAIDGQE